MTDRQEPTGKGKPEGGKKLTVDKEQLGDFEPRSDDDEQVRGGVASFGAKITRSLPGGEQVSLG